MAHLFLLLVDVSFQMLPCANVNVNECEIVSEVVERSDCNYKNEVAKNLTQLCLQLDSNTIFVICITENCNVKLTRDVQSKLYTFIKKARKISKKVFFFHFENYVTGFRFP